MSEQSTTKSNDEPSNGTMQDSVLADEIISRLNRLIESDEGVRRDVTRLVEQRIPKSELHPGTWAHATIQCTQEGLGFLGLLNGLIGTWLTGLLAGWGYISAEFDDAGEIVRFCRTREKEAR